MTETRAPTDYQELLERITGTWCWGQPENEADCAALRQLASLLREITPERVRRATLLAQDAGWVHTPKGPRRTRAVCTEEDKLFAVLAALTASPENPK